MDDDDARQGLERLIRERRETYSSVSRLLNRNAAYVQQFIKRGVPQRLDELDRRTLARHFDVDETLLGGSASTSQTASPALDSDCIALPFIGKGTCPFRFSPEWLAQLKADSLEDLAVLHVVGDAMVPTLRPGSYVIIDRSAATPMREGLYVIAIGDEPAVRRIAFTPGKGYVAVISDNPVHSRWEARRENLVVIGRAVWVGFKLD